MTLEAYCVKCKTKREIANAQPTFTSRGTPGVKGNCPVCGTTLFRMGATEAHASLPKPEIIAQPKKTARKAKPKTTRAKTKTKSRSTGAATRTTTAVAKKKASTSSGTGAGKKPVRRSIGKLVIVESPAKARSV